MRIRFTDEARARLRAIHTEIAKDAPTRADGMIDRITRRTEQIARWPYSGRMVPDYEIQAVREIGEPPYRIIYRVRADDIEIVTVIHRRQLLPADLKTLFGLG
jgi:plasmid stabilization system protein ParE